MQVEAVMARAFSAIRQGTRYELGKGGIKPGAPTPATSGRCDCSGFVAWCFGMSRIMKDRFYVDYNGGWFETSAVWKDIGSSVGIFEPIKTKKRGAVIVYPDDKLGGQGHIGIVVDNDEVVHCSKGNDTVGDAIQITDYGAFERSTHAKMNARLGWLVGLK
jgi:cell wall-associated NlpC family hydrolase